MPLPSYDGNLGSSRKAGLSRAPIPFDTPKPGSINVDDDERVDIPRQRRSAMMSGHAPIVGRNTLNQPRSSMKKGNEVSPEHFYEKIGGDIASMVVGTPSSRRLPLRQSPPDSRDSPTQFRNASKRPAYATKAEARKSTAEAIEITDSDDDDDIVKTDARQIRSSSKNIPTREESGSGSGSTNSGSRDARSDFGHAYVGRPIRRKSDSPQEPFDWKRSSGICIRSEEDIRGLQRLPNTRVFHISNPISKCESRGGESGTQITRSSYADKMKDKSRNPAKKDNLGHLGGRMPSALPGRVSVSAAVDESKLRPEANTPALPRLLLAHINLFGVAQVKSETSNPSIQWTGGCDVHLQWDQGKTKITLLIRSDEVKKFEMIDENSTRCLCITLRDKKKVVSKLCKQVGDAGSRLLMKTEDVSSYYIALLPLADSSNDLIDGPAWQALLKSTGNTLIANISLARSTFITFKGDLVHIRDLVRVSEAGNAIRSPFDQDRPHPRPSVNRDSLQSERISTRSSLRQKESANATDEEDRASTASVEAVTKAQVPTEPQKALLSYPFESPGAVNIFQSDLEKLDEQEMLNDTIVEFGLRYLMENIKRDNLELYDQIYVFSSFFYKRISENRRDRKTAYEFVKRWTKKVDIFKKKYLVVPINEKMHWYLAIITNPFYAVREVERRRGIYQADAEKEGEEEGEIREDLDSKKSHFDGVKRDETGKGSEEGSKAQLSEQSETLGDTLMEEENPRAVEVVVDASDVKSGTSTRGSRIMHMDLDEKDNVMAPFTKIPSPELGQRYERHKSQRTTVIDRRSTKSPRALTHPINLDEDESDEPILIPSISPRKGRASLNVRPGVSDGIKNKGKGTVTGGGGGTPIQPGQIDSFRKEEEREREEVAFAAKKRKADDEDQDTSMASPPRSRSGATYNGANKATYTRRSSSEAIQEKYQEWLKGKAVVCIFDSMASKHKAVKTALREYLCLEYNDKRGGGPIEVDDVELEHIDVFSPVQGNFCDCGLYLLHAFERFFNDTKQVMEKVIISRDRDDPYWQSEDAAKKRAWWRNCIHGLMEEYKVKQAQVKAEKEARLALKGGAKSGSGEEKSKTSSPSGDSRSKSTASPLNMASVESSLEEPRIHKAT